MGDLPTRSSRPGGSSRLRDQPLLPLPSASSAGGLASLSTAIQTVLPAPRNEQDSRERRYVRAVLARYLWLPDTPSQSSRHDRHLAKALFEGGVPLVVVEAALLLGAARRGLRGPSAPLLAPVRSLHYFKPVITEVMEHGDPDESYLTYLLGKLRPLAELKLARARHATVYGGVGLTRPST
jgi:hypothetical protein